MKRVVVCIVCLLFAVTGVFGMGGFFNTAATISKASGPVPTFPGRLEIHYADSKNEDFRPIDDEQIPASYHTTAVLRFSFLTVEAELNITIVDVVVTLIDGEPEEVIDDEDPESDRRVEFWSWEYTGIGLYEIEVFILDNEVPIHFTVFALCESAEDPQFNGRVSLEYDGNTITNPFNNWSGVEVRANPGNENFFWDQSVTTYSTEDPRLTLAEGDKHMILGKLAAGSHTLTFTVHYVFYEVEVGADGESFELIPHEETAFVTVTIRVYRAPRPATVWDVLIGIAILCALGGVLWVVTRLSKNVEQQQPMVAK